MILLTRLNGPPFAVNPDLLERVDTTPDTVLTLLDGTKYVVVEPVEDVIAAVRDFRAGVIARACGLVDPIAWAAAQVAGQDAEPAHDAEHGRGEPRTTTGPRAVPDDLAPAVPLRRRGGS